MSPNTKPADVELDDLPDTVGAAAKRFAPGVRRAPGMWISALATAVMLGLAVVGLPAIILAGVLGLVADGSDLPWGAIWGVAALLFAVVVVLGAISIAIGRIEIQSTTLGLEAFLRVYAKENRLELIEGPRFDGEGTSAKLPGEALHAMRGRLPGTFIDGVLVVVKDHAIRKEPLDYGLAAIGPSGTLATRKETPVADWSAETLDDFCSAAA